jgi:hypothetical protein
MRILPDITVAALEIAPVGDLELKITEGRDRGRIQSDLLLKRGFREDNQIFRQAKLDEFLIFLPHRRTLTPAGAEKKLITLFVQFVKFVFFDVVEIALFEIF